MAEENGTHLFTFGWLFSGFSFFRLRNRAMTSSLKTLKLDKQQLYITFKLANKLRTIARARKTR